MPARFEVKQEWSQETIKDLLDCRPGLPAFQDDYTYACYCSFYLFARHFCQGMNVLDAACGYGYGSRLLAKTASSVTGVDLSGEAIAFAGQHYGEEGRHFECMDVTRLRFDENRFDAIVSIETFEHLPPERTNHFIQSLQKVLKPGGRLILSTPVKSVYDQIARTPDHINEMDPGPFVRLFQDRFDDPVFYISQKDALKKRRLAMTLSDGDRFNLRRMIPKGLRKRLKRGMGGGWKNDFPGLLAYWRVDYAENITEMESAIFQIVAASNRK
ncbi:class I SAM-dependent methyltransferase [bacterium]|nr:class I SAM-dependent methyltransferase [bacterium]